MMQSMEPISKIHLHLNGFHCYYEDKTRQLEVNHFCSKLNSEMHQCVLYDSNKPDARLIGVEYIISSKLFNELSDEEKPYWHPHSYEIASGLTQAPRVPEMMEDDEMKWLIKMDKSITI